MGDRISLLEEKISRNPEQIFLRYSLGQALFDSSDYRAASDQFKRCVEVKPDWMMACLFVAKAELELGHLESAKVFLVKTIELADEQDHDDPRLEAQKILQQILKSQDVTGS